ncbi:MAG: lipid II:glycine glycyltransferase FemX [Candidatus Binatia bacterium]
MMGNPLRKEIHLEPEISTVGQGNLLSQERVTVVCLDPRTDQLWQRLLAQHRSSVFHSPAWVRVLTETYGLDLQAYVLLDRTEEPRAGVPFCRFADITGERMVILPFSDYCDPLVRDRSDWNDLMENLLSHRCPLLLRCLHSDLPIADPRFMLSKQAKWHCIDLRPDLDHLWAGLHDSSKRAIKKAQRDAVIVRVAETEKELRAFFDMHLRIRKRKYRLLAQPYRFFENIWHHFVETQNGALMIAVYQDEIIGGTFFLEWNDTLYYKFNASVPAHLDHRPNDLLIWEGMQYGKTKGYKVFDFGLSDWDEEGLVRYKRKFATEEKTLSFLRYVPGDTPTAQEMQARALLPALTQLFTDDSVSDQVTEQAGELLYRFFA